MAIIPLFRVVIFILITIISLAVLGICAHIVYLLAGYVDVYSSFAPLGLGVSCLSVVSLPLFLALGNLRGRVCTSAILFEIIWFFVLWMLWAGTAGDTVAGRGYYFPDGCYSALDDYYQGANQICSEFTVVEAFAFFNFFLAFVYYDVIFLYAIINAVRGRGVWTVSVKEAATGIPGTVSTGVPMVQPQFNAPPGTQYQVYGAYPYNAPQQVPPQGSFAQPYNVYPQPGVPQGLPAQPYNVYPQQVPPPQQYNAYPQQPPQGVATPPAQNQPYNYAPAPGSPQQQANYAAYSPSPSATNASPPQPNYSSQPALSVPNGYQGQPIPQQPQMPSPQGP